METCIDDTKLKKLLKETILELMEERKELFYEFFLDIMEDIGLTHAIQEGEHTKSIDK